MVNILVVAHDRLWVDAIAATLIQQPDMRVIAKVTRLDDLLAHIGRADVVVVHHDVAASDAVDIVRYLADEYPAVNTVVVGVPESAMTVLQYLESGAIGYVHAQDPLDHLVQVIRAVQDGRAMIDPAVATAMINRLAELRGIVEEVMPVAPECVALTERENSVLELISRGLTNQQIADELYIEVGTVKNHVHSILRKLNVRDRQQAAYYARNLQRADP